MLAPTTQSMPPHTPVENTAFFEEKANRMLPNTWTWQLFAFRLPHHHEKLSTFLFKTPDSATY
jgi:hypothetical protein